MAELRNKMKEYEIQGPSSSATPQSIPADVRALMDSLDPAHRRVAFLGFAEGMGGADRTKHIENYLKNFPSFSTHCGIGVIYKGPKKNRVPTKACYVGFTSSDTVREFLEKSKSHVFNVAGVTIAIKKVLH